jgi:hypothetical protein
MSGRIARRRSPTTGPAWRRLRRLAVPAAGCAFAVAMGACSVLTGLDGDYQLQSILVGDSGGGGGDGGGMDGTVTPTDGPTSSSDGSQDTNVNVDGGSDSASGNFCDTVSPGPNGFCSDFENGQSGAPPFGWDNDDTTNGSLAVVPNAGVNGSHALHAIATPTGSASGQAYVAKQVGTAKFTAFAKHTLSFDFKLVSSTTLYTASLGALGFGLGGGQYLGPSVYGSGVIDLCDPPGGSALPNVAATPGTWQHAQLEFTRSGSSGPYNTTLTIEGAPLPGPTPVGPQPSFDPGTSTLGTWVLVGAFFSSFSSGASPTVDVYIDNVLVTQSN